MPVRASWPRLRRRQESGAELGEIGVALGCIDTAEHHAEDLWNMGGDCIHHSKSVFVTDPTGYQEPLTEPRFHPQVELYVTSNANPEGMETASPLVHIHRSGDQLSMAQALALADALRSAVERYRSAGGVE